MRWTLMLIGLLAAACEDDDAPQACELPTQSAGDGACSVARGYLECGNCGCATHDRKSCAFCSGHCENICANGEFELACGGSPVAGRVYEQPPASCHAVFNLPSGTSIYCCPCS